MTRPWLGLLALALAMSSGDARADDAAGEAASDDHDDHSVGIGFVGTRFVPTTAPAATDAVVIAPDGTATLTVAPSEITVPLFGARFWFNSTIGADVGIGFNVQSGTATTVAPNPDPALSSETERATPSTLAVAARLGAPISVFGGRHYHFMLIPELDIGYSSTRLESFDVSTSGEPLDLRLSGFVFGVGARAAAELSFGFIDVPQLAVQWAWGLRLESLRRSGKIGDAEATLRETRIGTSWYGDPWDIFVGSLAVHYYF